MFAFEPLQTLTRRLSRDREEYFDEQMKKLIKYKPVEKPAP